MARNTDYMSTTDRLLVLLVIALVLGIIALVHYDSTATGIAKGRQMEREYLLANGEYWPR